MKNLPKNKDKLLKRAHDHIFSTGIGDSCSRLSHLNMQYGLAKMHFTLEKYGYEPDATFVTTPDETISRNNVRWESGFAYGGKLSWGSGHDKFMFLDLKPNCCGMLVGSLDYLPTPKEILKNVYALNQRAAFIHDVKVEWDFYKGNHFIDIFKVELKDKKEKELKINKYAVILHAGCPEFKGPNIHGSGLYWNTSPYLMKVSTKVKTPFGHTHIIQDSDAVDYYRLHNIAEDFAKKRRELAFKSLFRGGRVVINETHQGLISPNDAVLGCNTTAGRKMVPVSIRADLPSYIYKGKPNLSRHQIEILGFEGRAEELGVMRRLRNADILPHGGGYAFPDSLSVDKIFTINNTRYFQIDMANSIGKKIVSNMKELQFVYRGREVVQRTDDLELGEVKAVLHPVFTIKI